MDFLEIQTDEDVEIKNALYECLILIVGIQV